MPKILAGILFGVLVLYSGYSDTTYPEDTRYEDVVITFRRGACFGICPVYNFELRSGGELTYNGELYVKNLGKIETKIPEEDFKSIVDKFYELNFFSLKDEYTGNITDLPSSTLSFKVNNKEKSVYNYVGAPERLYELEDFIEETIDIDKLTGGGYTYDDLGNIQNQNKIFVFFETDTPESVIFDLRELVENEFNIESSEYVSSSEAEIEYRESLGEDSIQHELLEDLQLPANLEFKVAEEVKLYEVELFINQSEFSEYISTIRY